MKRRITKQELLLAIMMSEYYETSHVNYIPVNTEYIKMLVKLQATGDVEVLEEKYYKVTEKGRMYVKKRGVSKFRDLDSQIDNFVDNL